MFELIPFDRRVRSVNVFDPFRAMDEIERSFFSNANPVSGLRTDVSDDGASYKLEAELPGFNKEDIKLDVQDDCLTIYAERKLDKSEKKPNFVKRERFYGSYSRSFDVSNVNVDAIEASYNDGILSLVMPKKEAVLPSSRRLEIK